MERIVIIGSGNVATHLALCLDNDCNILQVVSRNIDHARRLAQQLRNAVPINNINEISTDADIYIVAVNDDEIKNIAIKTPNGGLWLHTSGSTTIDTFKELKKSYGVIYPLQTFSRGTNVNMREVPIFIEGNNDLVTESITNFARKISPNVFYANSKDRCQLHIAAVFACNFANHLWAIADEILKNSGYCFSVLTPLLRATLNKAEAISPQDGQTGPARRNDLGIINSHISNLDKHNAKIYDLLSQSIINKYHNNEQNQL